MSDKEQLEKLINFCRAMNDLEGDNLSDNELEGLAIQLKQELRLTNE